MATFAMSAVRRRLTRPGAGRLAMVTVTALTWHGPTPGVCHGQHVSSPAATDEEDDDRSSPPSSRQRVDSWVQAIGSPTIVPAGLGRHRADAPVVLPCLSERLQPVNFCAGRAASGSAFSLGLSSRCSALRRASCPTLDRAGAATEARGRPMFRLRAVVSGHGRLAQP